MYKLYDFMCTLGHTFESLEKDALVKLKCPMCTNVSKRVISPIKSLLDPLSFPSAEAKWIREHEKAGNSKQE